MFTLSQAREQLHFNQMKVQIIEHIYRMGRINFPSSNLKVLNECMMDLPHSFTDFHEVRRGLLLVHKIHGTNENATRTWVWSRVRTILPLISLFHLRYVLMVVRPRILFIFTGTSITSDIITLYEGALKNIYPELQKDENKGFTSNHNQNIRHLADGSIVSNRIIMHIDGSDFIEHEVDANGYDIVFLDNTCTGVKVLGCKNVVQFAGVVYSV